MMQGKEGREDNAPKRCLFKSSRGQLAPADSSPPGRSHVEPGCGAAQQSRRGKEEEEQGPGPGPQSKECEACRTLQSSGGRRRRRWWRRGSSVCCKCAAGGTADCVAVCCCPLAVLHLLALTLIQVPAVVVWRIGTSLKKRLCTRPARDRDPRDRSSPDSTPPWSDRDPPDPLSHVVRFDTQNLLKHFDAEYLGFGGTSVKRD